MSMSLFELEDINANEWDEESLDTTWSTCCSTIVRTFSSSSSKVTVDVTITPRIKGECSSVVEANCSIIFITLVIESD